MRQVQLKNGKEAGAIPEKNRQGRQQASLI